MINVSAAKARSLTFANSISPFAIKAIARWYQRKPLSPEQYEAALLKLQRSFKSYCFNIFILNKYALRIQHYFFKKRAGLIRNVQPDKKISARPLCNPKLQHHASSTKSRNLTPRAIHSFRSDHRGYTETASNAPSHYQDNDSRLNPLITTTTLGSSSSNCVNGACSSVPESSLLLRYETRSSVTNSTRKCITRGLPEDRSPRNYQSVLKHSKSTNIAGSSPAEREKQRKVKKGKGE